VEEFIESTRAQQQEDEDHAGEAGAHEVVEEAVKELAFRTLLVDEVDAARSRHADRQDHVTSRENVAADRSAKRSIALGVVVFGAKLAQTSIP